MKEVDIKGVTYRIGALDAMAQLKIVKRAVPVMGKLTSLYNEADTLQQSGADLMAIIEPVAMAIGELPDDALEYVCNTSLDACEVKQDGGGWAPLRVKGVTMYPVDLLTLLSLTAHVLEANLSNFFRDLPRFDMPTQAQTA